MKSTKRALALTLGTAIGVTALTGCYSRVTSDNYETTVVATFGDQKVYLNEVNFYLKMLQVTYDSYYDYFYGPYYGFSSKKEFYEYTGMTDDGSTIWDAMKEDAMAAVQQTYILCEHAEEYGIALSDEDLQKVADSVEEFMTDTDAGVIAACHVDEETLTDIFTKNALANRVYEYLVSDIDTTVNEADYRYTQVAYLSIKENTDADTSDNDVDEAEETESVDLEAKAAEVLEVLKSQMDFYAESGEDDDSIPYNAVIDLYSDETDITISYTASQQYAKPADSTDSDDDSTDTDSTDTDSTETAETLQSICWNNLSTGDYTTWYDEDNSVAYVVYCTNDDVEDAKESAIESELDNRRSDRFTEKYTDIVKNSSTFTVKTRVYSQVKYGDIAYTSDADADASGNDVDASDND
jgi:trigger factor/foldase protein PrsA